MDPISTGLGRREDLVENIERGSCSNDGQRYLQQKFLCSLQESSSRR